MGHYDSDTSCTSTDSSECGVGCGVPNPRCCPKKCSNPFLNAPAYYDFDCSSIQCCDPQCKPECDGDLCDTDTLTTCPKVEHYYKQDMSCSSSSAADCKRNRRGKCVECGYKKCKCEKSERCLPELLCYDDSDGCSSDSESECEPKCGWNTPYAPVPCPVAKKPRWCEKTESCTDSAPCDDKCGKYEKYDKCEKYKKPCPPKKDHKYYDDCGKKGKAFSVTLGSKDSHPWKHRIVGSNSCFHINGKAGKTIHVDEGESYTFNVNVPQQGGLPIFGGIPDHFYFTADPQGGRRGQQADSPFYDPLPLPGSPQPIGNGSMTLRVDSSYPPIFYYQSKGHPCMGYMVIKHGKKKY